ncbi:S1C family serine protease [Leptospira sp. 'Mane']|uniref:S1C family serine protease n=1 Tax=Leptospira sp. 'Mane' TaxID=3387407 RepID=UPI00398B54A7
MKFFRFIRTLLSFVLILSFISSCEKEANPTDPRNIFRSYVGASFSISLDSGPLEEPKVWIGSGFVFDKQGLGLTCSHVVPDDKKIVIRMGGTGKKFYARTIKRDHENDLAMLQIDNQEIPVVFNVANSYEPETGSPFYMISTSFGMEESFDSGFIANGSRLGADIFSPNLPFVQLNRMVLSGSSGAAVFDGNGKVLGVARFQLSSDGSKRDGIGFAIPSSVLREFVKSIPMAGRTKEEIQRGIVEIPILTAHLIGKLGLKYNEGVLVSYAEPGSVAEKAGIKRYDLVIRVNGNSIKGAEEFYTEMAKASRSEEVKLKIVRDHRELEIKIIPSE